MLLSLPFALVLYYLRWFVLARLGGLDGDLAARARRWARWERRNRPSPEGAAMARIDYWTYFFLRKRWPARTTLSMLTLPVRAGLSAFWSAKALGSRARAAHDRSVVAQALENWLLALRYPLAFGSDPSLYYLHEVFDPSRRGDAPYVFANLHHTILTLVLNGKVTSVMHKGGFEERCAELHLPHIPVLARVLADGRVRWLNGAMGLPAEDLFSKPAVGMKGAGAARWLWQPGNLYRAESGELLDAEAVLDELRAAARRGPLIVQRRVRNHPEVEALAGPTLATVRIVSVLTPRGAFEIVLAIHRSALDDAAVDNAAQGGVVCAIDLETGTLGRGLSMGEVGFDFHRAHPLTGALVEGVRLPCWPETLTLIERAHRGRGFHRYPVIGWDVALTAEGPVLVEANPVPGARSLQGAHRLALGRMPYARRLLELIERREPSGRLDAPADQPQG